MIRIEEGRARRRNLLAYIRKAFGRKLREDESGLTDFDLLPIEGLNDHLEWGIGYRRPRLREEVPNYRF